MKERNIHNVAVIGAGLMGLGIGVEYARFGYDVKLYNTGKKSSESARQRARGNPGFDGKNAAHNP